MGEIRVIGIGSPFGADRLGWIVIDALRTYPALAHITLLQCHQPGELANLLAGCQHAILIDALIASHPPGTLLRLGLADLPSAGFGISSHGFGVNEAMQLADVLGNLPPTLIVLGLEVGDPNHELKPEWIELLVQATLREIKA